MLGLNFNYVSLIIGLFLLVLGLVQVVRLVVVMVGSVSCACWNLVTVKSDNLCSLFGVSLDRCLSCVAPGGSPGSLARWG